MSYSDDDESLADAEVVNFLYISHISLVGIGDSDLL